MKLGEEVVFILPATESDPEKPMHGILMKDWGDGWFDVQVKVDWKHSKHYNVKSEWIRGPKVKL